MEEVPIFLLLQAFDKTDKTLATIETWPQNDVPFFETQLSFQIQHSLFRDKVSYLNKESTHCFSLIFFSIFKIPMFVFNQHFRLVFQIRDGEKTTTLLEVLDWYNKINSYLLNYFSTSIRESDLSSFYRYIIGFKNLMRSVEYCGKAGVWGIRLEKQFAQFS